MGEGPARCVREERQETAEELAVEVQGAVWSEDRGLVRVAGEVVLGRYGSLSTVCH
jgi:hypothetical protein